jgi:hypothetical protein
MSDDPLNAVLKYLLNTCTSFYRQYETPKNIIVDIWQVGLAYRGLQLFVFIFLLVEAQQDGNWAMSEVPGGSANAFITTTPEFDAVATTPDFQTLTYCGNEQYSYMMNANFDFRNPECEALSVKELVEKGPNSIFVTTVFMEEDVLGWPCALEDTSDLWESVRDKREECFGSRDDDPRVLREPNGQCSCTKQKTVYPVGVEHIAVAFEHAYDTSAKVGSLKASSTTGPLDTVIRFDDGTETKFVAGETPSATLGQILGKAGIPSLDEFAAHTPDARGPSKSDTPAFAEDRFPSFRTTGVLLRFDLEYTNGISTCSPAGCSRNVEAKVDVVGMEDMWAGWGSTTTFIEHPTGAPGSQSFHKIIRYRQGVVIEFRARGLIYEFDGRFFLDFFTAIIVLLGACSVVIDSVIFYMLPCGGVSALLYRKRNEKVNRHNVFATIGLKAATSVKKFEAFDEEHKGFLSYPDLVKMFGKVQDVDYEKACAIAQTVLGAAGTDHPTRPKELVLTYSDFVSLTEGNSQMAFGTYLQHVGAVARKAVQKKEEVLSTAVTAAADAKAEYAETETIAFGRTSEGGDADRPGSADSAPPDGAQKVKCGSCNADFFGPAGVSVVRCPHCSAVNQLGAPAALGPNDSI